MTDDPKPPEFPEKPPGTQAGNDPHLEYFKYEHLPPHLQEISKPFGQFAAWMCWRLPWSAQRDQAVMWLLLAKDAAVRASLKKA